MTVVDTWNHALESCWSPAPSYTGGTMRVGDVWVGAKGGRRRVAGFRLEQGVRYEASGRMKWTTLGRWNRWAANASKVHSGTGEEAPGRVDTRGQEATWPS